MLGTRVLRLLVSLALTVVPSIDAAQQAKVSGTWTRRTTSRFTVLSNAEPTATDAIAHDLERFGQVVDMTLNAADTAAPPEMTVYVFRNSRDIGRHLPAELKKNKAGWYLLASEDSKLFAVDADAWQEYCHILFREYTLDLLRRSYRPLPAWLAEGLAEYYSSVEVGGTIAYLGRPVDAHLEVLRSSTLLSLERLLAVDQLADEDPHDLEAALFRAQSWALVHYFLNGSSGHSSSFNRYFQAVESGGDPVEAFASSFPGSAEDLLAELEGYVKSNVFSFTRLKLQNPGLDETVETRELSKEEALHALDELVAHANPE